MANLSDKLRKRLKQLEKGEKIEINEKNKNKKALAAKLSRVQARKSLSEQVDELVQQINQQAYDRMDKVNDCLYVTELPAMCYDRIIVILNKQLKIYEDVMEEDLKIFERLVELEADWRSTRNHEKGSQFLYELRQLQYKYRSVFEEEPAMQYLQKLAKGDER